MSTKFPEIEINGDRIRPKDYIEKGTGLAVFGASLVAVTGSILGIAFTYGIGLIVLLLYPLYASYIRKKAEKTLTHPLLFNRLYRVLQKQEMA